MAAKTTSLHKLPGTKWKKVPTEEASETYDIMEATCDSVALEDLFGDEPEHFMIHEGDVVVSGPLKLFHLPDDKNQTVFVINGNLTIKGPFSFENSDVYTPLWVTGTLKAEHVLASSDACLIVGKGLTADQLVVCDLTDAGHFVVQGSTAAKAVIDFGDRGMIEFAKKPKARLVGGEDGEPLEDAVVPAFVDDYDFEALEKAVFAGKPVLK